MQVKLFGELTKKILLTITRAAQGLQLGATRRTFHTVLLTNSLLALILLVLPIALAQPEKEGNIKLLALIESGNESTGTVAELTLSIEQGKGRVFLETFPLTRIGTQISVRFAQQVTCKELETDCSNYDFFYTIKASPGVVGGPSAGAAAAVLTGVLLQDKKLDEKTAITGTINSGGLIGSVGGLAKKIEAAGKTGLKKVLIPAGTRQFKEKNETIDLVEHGQKFGVEVIETATLEEALEAFTGEKKEKKKIELVVDPQYQQTMKEIAEELCERAGKETNSSFVERGKNATQKESYYSAASYCFRANLDKQKENAERQHIGIQEFRRQREELMQEIKVFDEETEQRLKSVTDLQTYMAVKERIIEAQALLEKLADAKKADKEEKETLVYARERLFSARAWAKFFNGENGQLSKEQLRDSCTSKIAEAEERYSYVKSILPTNLKDTRKDIDDAYGNLQEKPAMCLYQASKAKAETDVVLSVIGVDEKRISEIIELKLESVRKSLASAQKKKIFPLLSYSYYEYAESLKEADKYSALLFAEYALELSNVDIYFEKKLAEEEKGIKMVKLELKKMLLPAVFVIGLVLGVVLTKIFSKEKKGMRVKSKKGRKR